MLRLLSIMYLFLYVVKYSSNHKQNNDTLSILQYIYIYITGWPILYNAHCVQVPMGLHQEVRGEDRGDPRGIQSFSGKFFPSFYLS